MSARARPVEVLGGIAAAAEQTSRTGDLMAHTTTPVRASSAGGGDHHADRAAAERRAARPNVSLGGGVRVGGWRLVVIVASG